MPASRSTSRRPLDSVMTGHTLTKRRTPVDDDVIVISSDEDEPIRRGPPKRKQGKPRRNLTSKSSIQTADFLEIGSSDNESGRGTHELKNEIMKLKEKHRSEMDEMQNKLEQARQHAIEVEMALQTQPSGSKPSTSHDAPEWALGIQDDVCCEICTLRMWTPYNLPCGHTFCSNCLVDWFTTILKQYAVAHPEYRPPSRFENPLHMRFPANRPAIPAHLAQDEHVLRHLSMVQHQQHRALDDATRYRLQEFRHYLEQERLYILGLRERQKGPQYTCPTCRADVKHKPSEVFALKSIGRSIAAASGDASPDTGTKPDRHIWDRFFGFDA